MPALWGDGYNTVKEGEIEREISLGLTAGERERGKHFICGVESILPMQKVAGIESNRNGERVLVWEIE